MCLPNSGKRRAVALIAFLLDEVVRDEMRWDEEKDKEDAVNCIIILPFRQNNSN